MPIVTGTLSPVRQPDRIEFDPKTGRQTWAVYTSADTSAISTARETYEANGQKCRSYGDGALFTVEVLLNPDDAVTDALQDSWAIISNELQRGDRQSPAWFSLAAEGTNSRAQINEADELKLKPSESLTSGLALQLYRRIYYGNDSYSISQYVLRHTTIASPVYDDNVSDANVESLYTTAQLLDEIQDAGLWKNPCPGRLVAKIESIPVPSDSTADDASDYLWSWRKLPSNEEQQPDGNIAITTEYWLGHWPIIHYATL
jgi:hypothetical protein